MFTININPRHIITSLRYHSKSMILRRRKGRERPPLIKLLTFCQFKEFEKITSAKPIYMYRYLFNHLILFNDLIFLSFNFLPLVNSIFLDILGCNLMNLIEMFSSNKVHHSFLICKECAIYYWTQICSL